MPKNIDNIHNKLLNISRKYFVTNLQKIDVAWWRHQMETFSALLALCAENSPVTGG